MNERRVLTQADGQIGRDVKEKLDMHPTALYDLAKIKISEEQEYARRQRMARQAVSDRPRPIDIAGLGERLRVRLFGGPAVGGRPAKAGA